MVNPKIYTKTGDGGTTSLADGSRTPKSHARIECYGTVDELNSIIGLCRSCDEYSYKKGIHLPSLNEVLYAIQNDLFTLGSDLATPLSGRWPGMQILREKEVLILEEMIDKYQEHLPSLRQFVLPGGSRLNASLHLARTVCRRAERETIRLANIESINPVAVPYLNRLSDLLFVLARVSTYLQLRPEESKETIWNKNGGVASLS